MYFKLIILSVFIPLISYSISEKEIRDFSKSNQWQKLLYYKASGHSIITSKTFFTLKDGKNNPLDELRTEIRLFKENQKNVEGYYYQCLFPARYMLLKSIWPNDFSTNQACKEFDEWLSGIDAGALYYVYSSAYPNNPASAFGHTFLRFDRSIRSQNKKTNELLGYTVAFLASPDPSDNAIEYTFKGVFGGYDAFLEIKPYYINIGIYNNSESRDLWEVKLNITEDEKKYLLSHIWELSHSARFNYKFATENCSSLSLRLLSIIKPNIKYPSMDDIFILPLATYVDVANLFSTQRESILRPSIYKKIQFDVAKFNSKQANIFKEGLEGLNIAKIKDSLVLNTLVKHYKFRTYKSKAKLDPKERLIRKGVYSQAAKQSKSFTESYTKLINIQRLFDPLKSLKPSTFGIASRNNHLNFNSRFGFHTFNDPIFGYDNKSYINFLNFNFDANEKKLTNFTFADILSLQDFTTLYKHFSWNASLKKLNSFNNETISILQAGIGISQLSEKNTYYFIPKIGLSQNDSDHTTQLKAGIDVGIKQSISDHIYFSLEYNSLEFDILNLSGFYSQKNYLYSISLEKNNIYFSTQLYF